MKRSVRLVWVLGLFGSLLHVGCGGDSDGSEDDGGSSGGSSGASGSATGGSTSGSGGSSATGGTATGGSATGGSATGGSATGGSATGGSAGSGGTPPSSDFPTGFGPPDVILTGLTFPVRLSIRDGYLYFTEMGLDDGTMSRLARRSPSGDVQTLFSGNRVAALHLDADELFFVERGSNTVYRMSYDTLEPRVFTTTTMTVADIETQGERVWITEFTSTPSSTSAVTVYDRSGAVIARPVPVTTNLLFTYMTVGGGNVYISELTGENLYKVPPSDTGTVTVSNVRPNHIASDAMHVYFTSQVDGRVLRQLHDVDERPEQLASGQSLPFAVTVDPGGAYWTNGGADCDTGTPTGSVYGVPLGSGTPVPVATGERCPQAIVTDGEYVYWTREAVEAPADDSIVRARKMP